MTARHQISFKNLGEALSRLEDVLEENLDAHDFVLDAAIQRFEFVVELYWKTLKHLLKLQGVETSLPKEALQKAYAARWIEDEEMWLQMLRDRNLTSHTYKHALALEIYLRIKQYAPQLRATYEKLSGIFSAEL